MTWHLKDRELEVKLNELSNGEFSKNLHYAVNGIFVSNFGEEITRYVPCLLGTEKRLMQRFKVCFESDEVEDIPDYNPNGWNEYPAVIPPEGVLMRVEAVGRSGVFRDCAIFKDGVWQSDMDGEACGEFYAKVKRFRPWED